MESLSRHELAETSDTSRDHRNEQIRNAVNFASDIISSQTDMAL